MNHQSLLLFSLITLGCTANATCELTPKEEILKDLLVELVIRKDKDLVDTLENVNSSLELSNDIIAQQQKYLVNYKRANNVKLVILTALVSSFITAIACKYQDNLSNLLQSQIAAN